ncbi:hypothetical protein [Rhizobium sp. 2MFCol3.1]|uniref:hypothetical protein n=1 Tax=Rhizobium sp. 2MFCol3.1 TaxID=1246459 RepID=UPI0012DF2E83|nr:hypothetical protein [Rhizobium sp. 2MFCol3.1]
MSQTYSTPLAVLTISLNFDARSSTANGSLIIAILLPKKLASVAAFSTHPVAKRTGILGLNWPANLCEQRMYLGHVKQLSNNHGHDWHVFQHPDYNEGRRPRDFVRYRTKELLPFSKRHWSDEHQEVHMNEHNEPSLAPSTDTPAINRDKVRFGRGAVWVGLAIALAALALYIGIGLYGGYHAVR